MLILTRRKGDKIFIGDDIVITITETKASIVKVGIEAPQSVPVVRGELPLHSKTNSMPSSPSKTTSTAKSQEKKSLKKIVQKVTEKKQDPAPDIESMMSSWNICNE